MGSPKKPPALDRFLPIDFETLQYVADHGQLTMRFDTDNQAMNTKYRLWRLKESLQVNALGDPLQKASKYFVFKVRKDMLTISNRVMSPEVAVQRAAIDGDEWQREKHSADPLEIAKDMSGDALERAYQEKLVQEQQNGKA
jgi:hypothetical protein